MPLACLRGIPILLAAFLALAFSGSGALAQSAQSLQPETHRKAVQKVAPPYPQAAKSMNLSGKVRLAVTVTPNGKVAAAAVLGGHPLLAQVAIDAVRQWRFEAAPEQTEEIVLITFQP